MCHPCTKTVQEWQVGLTFLICSCRFSVNKRIFVVGFGLYGSIHGPTDYQVNIQVNLCTTLKVLAAVGTNGHLSEYARKSEVRRDCICFLDRVVGRCSEGQMGHWG